MRVFSLLLGASTLSGCLVEHRDTNDVFVDTSAAVDGIDGINYVASFSDGIALTRDTRQTLNICTFNIKWLGHYDNRPVDRLVAAVEPCDILAVQELVNPPVDIPEIDVKKRDNAAQFFDAMAAAGFDGSSALAHEDTGTGEIHNSIGATSEYGVIFFRSTKVRLLAGFKPRYIDAPLSKNSVFDRVPYAAGFEAKGAGGIKFVLISVHLHEGSGQLRHGLDRRNEEFVFIAKWIQEQQRILGEKRFLLLGDTNIQNCGQVTELLADELAPLQFTSLNRPTTKRPCAGTNLRHEQPFDQVFYSATDMPEVLPELNILDLLKAFPDAAGLPPMDFAQKFSDHNALLFRVKVKASPPATP